MHGDRIDGAMDETARRNDGVMEEIVTIKRRRDGVMEAMALQALTSSAMDTVCQLLSSAFQMAFGSRKPPELRQKFSSGGVPCRNASERRSSDVTREVSLNV